MTALDHAADRYAAVREKYGPLSLVGACNNANVGRGVSVVMLLRSLGSPNWMINQDLCGGCRAVSSRATGLDITRGEDIDNARCALVVGRNSYEADPIEWIALKKLKKRGGQIIVIDPKRMPTVGIADLWLATEARHRRRHRAGHDPRDDRGRALRQGVRRALYPWLRQVARAGREFRRSAPRP